MTAIFIIIITSNIIHKIQKIYHAREKNCQNHGSSSYQVITGGDVNALKVKTRRIWVGEYLLRNGCRGIEHQYKTDEQRKKNMRGEDWLELIMIELRRTRRVTLSQTTPACIIENHCHTRKTYDGMVLKSAKSFIISYDDKKK